MDGTAGLAQELARVLNARGIDSLLDTPDYVLAERLVDCLFPPRAAPPVGDLPAVPDCSCAAGYCALADADIAPARIRCRGLGELLPRASVGDLPQGAREAAACDPISDHAAIALAGYEMGRAATPAEQGALATPGEADLEALARYVAHPLVFKVGVCPYPRLNFHSGICDDHAAAMLVALRTVAATPVAQRRPAREVPSGNRVVPITLDPFVKSLADRWWDHGEGDDHWGVLTGALSEMLAALEADRRGTP